MITFVRETQGLDFVGAIEWLAERFRDPARVRGELARRRTRAGTRRERLLALLERRRRRSTSAHLWDSQAGSLRARLPGGPRPRRGDLPRVPARPRARRERRSRARRSRRASPREELRAAGLTRQRGGDYFQRRLLFPLADARGRVLGFQARQLHEDDPLHGEVREHARVGALPQGRGRLRARQGARGDRDARTARASSRGTPT